MKRLVKERWELPYKNYDYTFAKDTSLNPLNKSSEQIVQEQEPYLN